VANPVACKARFDVAKLQCDGVNAPQCLNPSQVKAVQILHKGYTLPFPVANGITHYPGWGVSGEGIVGAGGTPLGGWMAWTTGDSAPTHPPKPDNARGWFFGNGAMRHIYAQDPKFDITKYNPAQFRSRVLQVSALMDSTNPDLSAFHARGGKLLMLEQMADYAQSPYAGIAYFESVQKALGADKTSGFMRLFTAPGVDHVGSGAPANFDVLGTLAAWVEQGKAPAKLTVAEQDLLAPHFPSKRELPLCEWPTWPRYRAGNVSSASSFDCVK
jgi:Tannase and feruloyl esterase